jgi:uncharacterized ubiquitin-like protein YukD
MTTENQAVETPEVPQDVTADTQQEAGQPAADLNVSDLAAIKSIIDVATQRGAFRAPELEAVGKTYNKLSNFLDSITKKEQ